MNTKATAYQQIENRTSLYNLILTILTDSKPMSRREIAQCTGLRLSSVCGRVNELLADNQIKVVGNKFDSDSNRYVQTVGIRNK